MTTSHLTNDFQPVPGLVSFSFYWRLMSVVLGLDLLVAVAATAANIITIMVYRRLGYADSTNISLTALAISDLGVAITTFNCVIGVLLPTIPNVPFTYEIFFLPASSPHVLFSRASALITTYLSIERYLCVSIPLKIKRIITPKRTLVAMIVIFMAALGPFPVVCLRWPVGWRFYPERNKTLLGTLFVTDPTVLILGNISQVYVSLFLPVFTFFTVFICTILLAVSLKKSKAWRDANKSTTSKIVSKGDDSLPESVTSKSKEAKAVRMLISIATVFIISSIPSSIHMFFVLTIPEFDLNGRYSNLYSLTGMMFLVVDCINCTANVFIYYNMSSKFRRAMLTLFFGKHNESNTTKNN